MNVSEPIFNDVIDAKFHKIVLPNLKEYTYYKLKRIEISIVVELVSKYLGLENKFEIKDKFEGDTFLNNNKRIYSTMLNITKNNKNLKIDSELTIESMREKVLKINDKKFRIVNFRFGALPLISLDKDFILNGLILSVNSDEISSYICGFISSEELLSLYKQKNKKDSKRIEFDGFSKLKPISVLH